MISKNFNKTVKNLMNFLIFEKDFFSNLFQLTLR